MSDPLTLLLAGMAGGVLGTFFFLGLWWTVRKAVSAKHPALWIFGSLLLRTSTALAGFYLVSGGHADRLLMCLLGFVVARVLVMRRTMSSSAARPQTSQEASHAP